MADSRIGQSSLMEHANALIQAFDEFAINNVKRICAALAQFGHETGGFRWLRELGGASYFLKYDNRRDLGNNQPGDGVKFKGRGYIQITGRDNYERIGQKLDLPLVNQPELAELPAIAARISSCWWQDHGLNQLADKNNFYLMTKIINGGHSGYSDRIRRYQRLQTAMRKSNEKYT